MPRTSRSIWPRFTTPITALERSTVGAAGFKRVSPNVIPPTATRPMTTSTAVRIRFFSLDFPERLISTMINALTVSGEELGTTGFGQEYNSTDHDKSKPMPTGLSAEDSRGTAR